MHYLADFFAGVFLCNCIPHLACGLQGAPFPTPFARPHGVGNSPPLVNFFWGALNLLVGLYLLSIAPVVIGPHADFAALVIGALLSGTFMAWHFGKVRRDKAAHRSEA